MNNEMKSAIETYNALGFNLIPVRGKQPWNPDSDSLLSWDAYKNERYPIERVRELEGVAVILGEISGNLIAIDLDPYEKKLDKYVKRDANTQKLITRIWETYKDKTMSQLTGRNGYRLIFSSDNSYVPKVDVAPGVAVMSNGHYIVLAPSPHPSAHIDTPGLESDAPRLYSAYNKLPPMHVEGWFYDAFCAEFGFDPENEPVDVEHFLQCGVQPIVEGKCVKCCKPVSSITRNAVTMAVAEWFFKKGYSEDDIIQRCLEQNLLNASPDKERDVRSAVKYQLTKHYKINFLKQPSDTVTVDDLDLEMDIAKHTLLLTGGVTDDFLYEGIHGYTKDFKEVFCLLTYTFASGEVAAIPIKKGEKELTIGGKKYVIKSKPIVDVPGVWEFGSAIKWAKNAVYPEPRAVFNSFLDVYNRFVDVDTLGEWAETHKVYSALWALATYFYEAFGFFPMRMGLGYTGSGKTTEMQAVGFQSYHCSIVYTIPTAAIIFRVIETCKATIMLDNLEKLYDKNKMDEDGLKISEMLDVGSYANGKVARIEGVDEYGDFRLKEYAVYGPKMLTAVMGFAPSMMTRAIPSHMVRTDKKILGGRSVTELYQNPRFDGDYWPTRIKKNREMMYALRFKLWKTVESAIRTAENDFKDLPLIARGVDVWKPILIMAKIFCPENIPKLLEYANHIEELKGEDYNSEVNESMIKVLIDVAPEDGKWVYIADITTRFNALVGGDEGDQNQRNSGKRSTERQVGAILKTLGFTARRTGGGNRTMVSIPHMLLKRHANALHLSVGPSNVGESVKRMQNELQFRKPLDAFEEPSRYDLIRLSVFDKWVWLMEE